MARTSTARSNAAKTAAAAVAAAETLTQSAVAAAKSKAQIAIFTRDDAKVKVALFLNTGRSERAPMFGGTIGQTHVSAFVRQPGGNKPAFLSFVDANNLQIGTANVRIRADGTPALKALLGNPGEAKTEVWFSISKNVSDEMLGAMGAKMDRLHVNRKEQEQEAAAA